MKHNTINTESHSEGVSPFFKTTPYFPSPSLFFSKILKSHPPPLNSREGEGGVGVGLKNYSEKKESKNTKRSAGC